MSVRGVGRWAWWSGKLSLVVTLSWLLVTAPQRALAFSTTGYSRVVREAEMIAWAAARRASAASAVGSAAAAGASSVAWLAVTGPLGWAALGVMTGMVLYEWYYSGQDLQDLKDGAKGALPPDYEVFHPNYGTFRVPGPAWNSTYASVRPAAHGLHAACNDGGGPYDWSIGPYPNTTASVFQGPLIGALRVGPTEMHGDVGYGYYLCHFAGASGSATQAPAREPTGNEIADYLNSLPNTDPRSLPAHGNPVGAGHAPMSATQVESTPINATEIQTQAVPVSQVQPRDTVVKENEVPLAGMQTQTQTQQQTSKTTTATTNPDGSVTEHATEEATASCTAGQHDAKTLRTIWEDHKAKWQSSGLLAALELLKQLTWPAELPTITFTSQFFGTRVVNFNDWAWAFTAARAILIAGATFVAYRIVFVGG